MLPRPLFSEYVLKPVPMMKDVFQIIYHGCYVDWHEDDFLREFFCLTFGKSYPQLHVLSL